MNIYVASSWRNQAQPAVVEALRQAGHEVYDFRHPEPGNEGFRWTECDPNWQSWDAERFREKLNHPVAVRGFGLDFRAMQAADACVMLLPCGRSAHLEAGWFVGAGKILLVLFPDPNRPEPGHSMDPDWACAACGDLDGCHVPAKRRKELEPELMYRMANSLCLTIEEVVGKLAVCAAVPETWR